MSSTEEISTKETHQVFNQAPLLVDYNLYETDKALREAVTREGADWINEELCQFGKILGTKDVMQWGIQANENGPVLRTHDRYGYRADEVEFHPAWHELMALSVKFGLHSLPWEDAKPGAHVARAALTMLTAQNETGHLCPISMTYSVVPALRKQPEIAAAWEEKICSRIYDRRFMPAKDKAGVIFGMAMTEKQGGSDVRANTTRAVPVNGGGPGGEYLLTGHKWFCSAPMSDAFLVLAQAPKGLSCFLVPRWLPDGTRNRFFLQRLKSKLGNRSNASSEVEFDQTWGQMIGEEGRGVATIIEMVTHTRLDCVIASSANIRQALVQAIHHCTYRNAFGKRLVEQPLMQNVLADLAVESEAATVLMMRLARAFDKRADRDHEGPFQRIATAISKYWVCKRGPAFVYEALECLGGNGYVEESIMPRLYREMPLYSIWEGSGNVICLDVLRAMAKEPESFVALMSEIKQAQGSDQRLDSFVEKLERELKSATNAETQARYFNEKLALALQGSLLVRFGHPAIADAFCASRLGDQWGHVFGTLPNGIDFNAIIERAAP